VSLGKGANLFGILDAKYDVYPDYLEKGAFITVAFTGKGWGPWEFRGSGRNKKSTLGMLQ